MLTISEVLMWCYSSLHYPNQTEPSRWQRIVALKKWHNAFTSNYSFRCLKKTKKNLDIVIRHLLWKLVQECEEFPVNQARTKVYSALCHGTSIIYVAAMERFNLHKKVRRIVPALDMCYTLQLVNDRKIRSQSKFKKKN